MRNLWKNLYHGLSILGIILLLTAPAFAAELQFSDVPPDAPYFDAVEYMAERGITVGTGENCYSPDAPITVRQWAVMLCRAFDRADALHDTGNFGSACLTEAYRSGWINENAVLEPDTRMCRGALYESAFDAVGLPVYDYALYPGGAVLSTYDNCLRIGAELGLCPEGISGAEIVTRGEVAVLLHAILTQDFQVAEPPVLTAFPIENREGVNMNDYLLELQSVPEPILQAFQRKGWTYTVDYQYLAELGRQLDLSCIGAADYSQKRIYVSEASSTRHEFGHFLDYALGSPSKSQSFYEDEGQAASAFLRDYALTNCREYFADYFVYWLKHHDNEAKAAQMRLLTPKTCEYFTTLAENGWGIPAEQ